MLVWVPVFVAIPYLEAPPLSTQFDWTSQFDEQLWSRPSMVKLVLLMNVSDWKPGMFTAPGNGGSGCRFTTTSMILVAPLKGPVGPAGAGVKGCEASDVVTRRLTPTSMPVSAR